jgi:hypothetical protein
VRRCARLLIALSLALVLAPASAYADTPTVHQVAAALKQDPVYVATSERGQLSPATARRLRRTIARLDRGRVQIAVVPAASADRVGGIRSFANAVDQAMPDRRGALIATSGRDFQVVTSYSDVDPTLGALRHAISTHEHDGLGPQLLAGVEGIADVDPGARGDINGPSGRGNEVPSQPVPAPGSSGGGSDAGAIVAIVIGALVLIPLLALGIWALLRWRGRHKAAAEMEELDLGSTRDELLALGQDIEDLDIDTQMPNAPQAGVQEYQRALMLYERGNRAFADKDPSRLQISEAKRAAEEGRAHIEAARRLLGTDPTPPAEAGGEAVHPPS